MKEFGMNEARKTVLVTGGAGFIGSHLIDALLARGDCRVVNFDNLGYAASPKVIAQHQRNSHYRFEKVDIADAASIFALIRQYAPNCIFHLAAETHVDRSISHSNAFIQTNIVGSFNLLEAARQEQAAGRMAKDFRFIQVSTDEVFGSLGREGLFDEQSRYQPNSPYAASKASGDHLARAWHQTYDLPVIITNCSNNYGPGQYPEKLIPLMIAKAQAGESLPIYGNGENVRDWLHVSDHVQGLLRVMDVGTAGETYLMGGGHACSNLELVTELCRILDRLTPKAYPHEQLISFVADRAGHDFRYAIDSSKTREKLGWHPKTSCAQGLEETVCWYLQNEDWWSQAQMGAGYSQADTAKIDS